MTGAPASRTPRVSVCLCAYNGAPMLKRAIDSVLAQTYGRFELVIVDDASTDETARIAAGYQGERVRVVRNAKNLGNARNRSHAIRLSRFGLIKFVDQDDWLEPSCLEEHVRCMDANPTVGLTFSRCAIAIEDVQAPGAEAWVRWSDHVRRFTSQLRQVNRGGHLLDELVENHFHDNLIGGPTSVMLRRTYLQKSALFNRRLRQLLDLDLWARLMAFSDVGYLDHELATRWVGRVTETHSIRAARRDWLDRLWLVEGLLELPTMVERYPELEAMRRAELKSVLVSMLTGRFRTASLSRAMDDIGRYAAWRLRASASGASLFDRL